MSADEIKIEQIDLKPYQSYVSPEVKAKQQFKYFNNTFIYISIRPEFTKKDSESKLNLRQFWTSDLKGWLAETKQDEENKLLKKTDVDKLELHKVYETYLIVKASELDEMKEVCKALSKRKEILACEYLDKKRVFGDKASLDEMSSFKSRVK